MVNGRRSGSLAIGDDVVQFNHSPFTIHHSPFTIQLDAVATHTFNNRYSRSHGLITSMKVSNSARLIAA
jgi:hypothetical protein